MQYNYRSRQDMQKAVKDLKKWMDETIGSPAEEMADFFTKRIDGYEDVHLKHWDADYRRFPSFIPESTRTLLDIGCGSGLELDEIFKKLPKLQVTGIDNCEVMLHELQKKHGDKDMELIYADYFQYPFEKTQYDGVISSLSLHHFEYSKKSKIYKKIHEAVKDGGFYLELDYMAQDEEWERLNLTYCRERRKRSGIPDDVSVHIDLPLTVEHQVELLEQAGFEKVEVLNKPFETDKNTVFMRAWK